MTFKFSPFMVNQMSFEDCQALEQVEKIIDQFQKYYDEGDVLMSANDGEIIQIKELARVKGIISFIMRNRVVEVNPN
jgi:hypothetical protein